MDPVANPAPTTTFDSVFDRLTGTLYNLGGDYLTMQGQVAVAKQYADAQARLNSYSAVNPSLGPVNPAQAQAVANQTLLQKWLPGGSPVVGSPATGQKANQTVDLIKWGAIAAVVLIAVIAVFKMFKKS